MAGPDGNSYASYQNESTETKTLLSPSPPCSPDRSRARGASAGEAAAAEDVRKHYKYALGTGYMFAMGVCGIVLVALGSTLDDLAENCGTTSTEVSACFQRRLSLLVSFSEQQQRINEKQALSLQGRLCLVLVTELELRKLYVVFSSVYLPVFSLRGMNDAHQSTSKPFLVCIKLSITPPDPPDICRSASRNAP